MKKTISNQAKRKKGDTGKRYTVAERKAVLNFVDKFGRGGITAACRKFGVSYIALRRWIKFGAAGVPRTRRSSAAGLDGRKIRRVKTALSSLKSVKRQLNQLQNVLKQLSK